MLKTIFALLAGAILPLAFAPFSIYTIAVISTAVLFFLWQKDTAKQAAFHGFIFGLGFFGFGVYWVYISIHVYGNTSVSLAMLITFLFIAFLALFPALQGYLQNRFFKNSLYRLLIITPLLWTLFELLRTWLFTGFPWLMLGYSQIDAPLRGFAPIIGVYGISFLTAYTSAAFVSLYVTKNSKIKVALIASIFILWISGVYLAKINWTKPTDENIKVSLIQGNIPQELKWQAENRNAIMQQYYDLTSKNWDADIIVWPEAAIPDWLEQQQKYVNKLSAAAKKHNVTIITGVPIADTEQQQLEKPREKLKTYNGIVTLGNFNGRYLKKHLVPFGEYIPLETIFGGFFKWFDIPMSDFSSGHSEQPDLIAKNNIILAPFLCYEIAYIDLVADYLPKAQLLLTISDDSWFGKSIALAQHLEIARMRSLETGRYQLVVANTGFTAIIDDKGKTVSKAPPFEQAVLNGQINAMDGSSPFVWVLSHVRAWGEASEII